LRWIINEAGLAEDQTTYRTFNYYAPYVTESKPKPNGSDPGTEIKCTVWVNGATKEEIMLQAFMTWRNEVFRLRQTRITDPIEKCEFYITEVHSPLGGTDYEVEVSGKAYKQ